MANKSATVYFDSIQAAAAGLSAVLIDARMTDSSYRFGSLSAQQILVSGLRLEGEVDKILGKLSQLPGADIHED